MRDIPLPRELGLEIEDWRPGQALAIQQVNDAFDRGVETVLLHGPPGSGKTAVAAAVARMREDRAVFLTVTKTLQHLYAGPPTHVPLALGRSNHQCTYVPGTPADEAPCTWGWRCPLREAGCPYFAQRDAAIAAPEAVANYALVLADPDHALLKDRTLIVDDEAHMLEAVAARQFAPKLDLQATRDRTYCLPRVPDTSDAGEWIA